MGFEARRRRLHRDVNQVARLARAVHSGLTQLDGIREEATGLHQSHEAAVLAMRRHARNAMDLASTTCTIARLLLDRAESGEITPPDDRAELVTALDELRAAIADGERKIDAIGAGVDETPR